MYQCPSEHSAWMPFAVQVLHYDWWTHRVCLVFSSPKNFFFCHSRRVVLSSVARVSTQTNVLISTQLKNWHLWKAFSGLLSPLCTLLWYPCLLGPCALFLQLWEIVRLCLGLSPCLAWEGTPLGSRRRLILDFPL